MTQLRFQRMEVVALDSIMGEEKAPRGGARVGVIVCGCGNEIGSFLSIDDLLQRATSLPGVVYTATGPYPCSKDGRQSLQQAIKKQRLDRLVIAGCTPRLIESSFKRTAEDAGLHPSYVSIANIREQCIYAHADQPRSAQRKAFDLIAMAVHKTIGITPARHYSSKISQSAMVVGSGIPGLAVALTLADNNIDVTLVDRDDCLTEAPSSSEDQEEKLQTRQIESVLTHPRIRYLTCSQVTDVSGIPGDYLVTVSQNGQATPYEVGAVVLTGDHKVSVADLRTGNQLPVPCDHASVASPYQPDAYLDKLAYLFHLPQDQDGYLIEPRVRLYPEAVVNDGVFAIGFTQYHCIT